MPYYEYPRPAVTVDAVLFSVENSLRKVLLIQRKNDPFKEAWALPGGFVDEHEGLMAAARRELEEETAIADVNLVQFRAYGDPGRDPRGHTVSVVFVGVTEAHSVDPKAQDDAKAVAWFPMNQLPELAFDHAQILSEADEFAEKEGLFNRG